MDSLDLMDYFPQFISAGEDTDTSTGRLERARRNDAFLDEIEALRLQDPDVEPVLRDICREVAAALSLPTDGVVIVVDAVMADTASNTLVQRRSLVTEREHRCFAGMPLVTARGFSVGSLCIAGTEGRILSGAELQMLGRFTTEAVRRLETRRIERHR